MQPKDKILEEFFQKVGTSPQSVIMSDYDGTVAPYAVDRLKAFPYPGIKEVFQELIAQSNIRFVMVSGRKAYELARLLDLDPAPEIWGSYGMEKLVSPDKYETIALSDEQKKGLQLATEGCEDLIGRELLEVKPFSLALHWRSLPPGEVIPAINELIQRWEIISPTYGLELLKFELGLELKPKGLTKGDVVRSLLESCPIDTPVAFLGDDLADEAAFAALKGRGLKVLVRDQPRETLADLILRPGEDVVKFFQAWLKVSQNALELTKKSLSSIHPT